MIAENALISYAEDAELIFTVGTDNSMKC